MKNPYLPFIAGAIVIILVAVAMLWYAGVSPFKAKQEESGVNISGITFTSSITDTSVPAPKVPRKVKYPGSMPKESQKVIADQIKTLADDIESDPLDIGSWLDLALQYKAADDIEGAEEVWEYLTQAAPEHSLSYYNLGYLYHVSLKDYPKSEEYYKKALAIDANQELYYTGLHELYRYSYKKESNAVVDIIKEGIGQVPDSINLRLTLAGYYRDEKGDKKNAIKYFTQARDIASEQGNAQLVMMLDKEISSLSK